MKGATMPVQRVMQALDRALDAESYEWLSINQAQLLAAIETEVANGHTPEQIRRRVMQRTGRYEIAARCEQAARHVASVAV